jgi:hypothetical protein
VDRPRYERVRHDVQEVAEGNKGRRWRRRRGPPRRGGCGGCHRVITPRAPCPVPRPAMENYIRQRSRVSRRAATHVVGHAVGYRIRGARSTSIGEARAGAHPKRSCTTELARNGNTDERSRSNPRISSSARWRATACAGRACISPLVVNGTQPRSPVTGAVAWAS